MKHVRPVITTTAAVALAGALALGAAIPASAATPDPSSVGTSAPPTALTVPTPGVTGIQVVGGGNVLSGTGVPGAFVVQVPAGLGRAQVGADGTWQMRVGTFPVHILVQVTDDGRSGQVAWQNGSAPIAGGGAQTATPTPTVDGVRTEGGRTFLVGTATAGNLVYAKVGIHTTATKVDADGHWKVDVTGKKGTASVTQSANGTASAAVTFVLGA